MMPVQLRAQWENLGDYRWPLVAAVLCHLIVLLFFSIQLSAERVTLPANLGSSIPAIAVNSAQVDAVVDRIQAKKRAIKRKKLRQLAIAKKTARAKAAREKAAKALKVKQLAAKKNLLAKQAALMKQLNEKAMQADKKHIARIQSLAQTAAVNSYKTKILQAISSRWIVPSDLSSALSCQLMVQLAPGGVVLSVRLLKSSGDRVLDRSATTAVYKASPLPVPEDPALFDQFRALKLTVRPDV